MSVYIDLAKSHPNLTRGHVWCHTCGRNYDVDSAECFRRGWPVCCGQTMSIDSPEEWRAKEPADAKEK